MAKPKTRTFLFLKFEMYFIINLFISSTFYFTLFWENKKGPALFSSPCYQVLKNLQYMVIEFLTFDLLFIYESVILKVDKVTAGN
ncbi:hypothetical protein C4K46_02085 [Streptococcus oricebi]|uniref:Uncharacterized protein n=1 Tax=Streptococcus oricebi TaxID=1547447 RepID=A0ABS5B1M8_9STRE|nr:hypothetical protein [Streptococcus oricebi]